MSREGQTNDGHQQTTDKNHQQLWRDCGHWSPRRGPLLEGSQHFDVSDQAEMVDLEMVSILIIKQYLGHQSRTPTRFLFRETRTCI